MSRNQPDEVLDGLADALKQELGGGESQEQVQEGEESSLKKEENSDTDQDTESSTESTTKQDEDKSSEATSQEKSEKSEEQVTDALGNTEESDTHTFSKQEYEELLEIKKKYEESQNTKSEVDLEWFKSEEGQLWATDLDNIDIEEAAISLAVERIAQEKGFSLEEALEELEDQYPDFFDDEADEDSREYKRAERNIIAAAKQHLETLKQKKENLEVPFKQSEKTEQIAKEDFNNLYTERLKAEYQQRADTRAQIADSLIKGKEKVDLEVGDVTLEYEMKKEVAEKMKKDLTNLENIGLQFTTEDGKIDEKGLFEFLLWKNDRQTLLDIYTGIKTAEAKEKTIKTEVKNSNFNSKSPQSKTIDMPEDHPLYEATKALAQGEV